MKNFIKENVLWFLNFYMFKGNRNFSKSNLAQVMMNLNSKKMEYLYFFLFESILILFLPFEHHYSLINLFVSLIYIEKPFFILLSLELIFTVVKTFT